MHRLSCSVVVLVCLGCGAQAPAPAGPGDAPPAKRGGEQPAPSGKGLVAADPSIEVKTLFVNGFLVDCEGVAPMQCLQVRESEQDEWVNFYDVIEGFEHRQSYRYELRVEVTTTVSPAADKSSKRYRLLEVVSEHEVGEEP